MNGKWTVRDGRGRPISAGRDLPGGHPAIPERTKWLPPRPAEPIEDETESEDAA